jgi:hypothetical protein
MPLPMGTLHLLMGFLRELRIHLIQQRSHELTIRSSRFEDYHSALVRTATIWAGPGVPQLNTPAAYAGGPGATDTPGKGFEVEKQL